MRSNRLIMGFQTHIKSCALDQSSKRYWHFSELLHLISPYHGSKLNVSAASVVVTQHRTTAKKSRYPAVCEHISDAQSRFRRKVKPKDLKVGESKAWSVFKNAQRRRLCRKKKVTNGKFSTWAPWPTLKFCFVLHQEVQLFLHFLYQSFKFYIRLQSSNSIFNFTLQILSSCFLRQIGISS